mmetsp:Transcript_416/g.813  ORF Transcript_416/g.813 Transcript_416/m.813 type:complete len:598 (-) Transcript_416:283-2076(-)
MCVRLLILLQVVAAFQLRTTPWTTTTRQLSSSKRFSSSFDEEATRAFKRALQGSASSNGGGLVKAAKLLAKDAEIRVQVTKKDAEQLLDGIPAISAATTAAKIDQLKASGDPFNNGNAGGGLAPNPIAAGFIDDDAQRAVQSVYEALQKRALLRGFGSVQLPGGEPCAQARPLTAEALPALIGVNQSALTPGGQGNLWAYAGVALCALEYGGAQVFGVDPLTTVLPLTLGALAVDKVALNGAGFEAAYRLVAPQYREKVVRHEAAHFLTAYLLGCPVESCYISAADALKDPRLSGQAGVMFFDSELNEQMKKGKLTSSSVDRFSIIVMAGIAAEARHYGQAEGGSSDEQAIVSFLSSLGASNNPSSPRLGSSWDLGRIRDQARWGVVQASLLIEEHQASYEALVQCLLSKDNDAEGSKSGFSFGPFGGFGDSSSPPTPSSNLGRCVRAIEDNLPLLANTQESSATAAAAAAAPALAPAAASAVAASLVEVEEGANKLVSELPAVARRRAFVARAAELDRRLASPAAAPPTPATAPPAPAPPSTAPAPAAPAALFPVAAASAGAFGEGLEADKARLRAIDERIAELDVIDGRNGAYGS